MKVWDITCKHKMTWMEYAECAENVLWARHSDAEMLGLLLFSGVLAGSLLDDIVSCLVSEFGPHWNISATIGCIGMKFWTDYIRRYML